MEPISVVPQRRGAGHLGRARPALREGSFGAWLLEASVSNAASSSSGLPGNPCLLRRAVALAQVKWEFTSSADGLAPAGAGLEPGAGIRGEAWGTVSYSLERIWSFSGVVPIGDTFQAGDAVAALNLFQMCQYLHLQDGTGTVDAFLDSSNIGFHRVLEVEDHVLREAQFGMGSKLLLEVPLQTRLDVDALVRDHPPLHDVRRWRTALHVGRAPNRPRREAADPAEPVRETHLTHLPPGFDGTRVWRRAPHGNEPPQCQEKRTDPLKLINAVAFALHLKSVSAFSDAMDDAHKYNADVDMAPPERDRSQDESRRTLERGKRKMDIVGCLLERRIFKQELDDDLLDAVNVYTDGSPVSGTELQGMVLDFCYKNGRVRRLVLPGATLNYGHFDGANKTISLLHALWLVCGPDEYHLRAACQLVSSVTTDFGVEMVTSDMPDVIEAYLAWMGGQPLADVKSKIVFGKRLFPNSIRIAGWNHTLSSIMKSVVKACDKYPEHLAMMRDLCTFFRNETYRDHLIKLLKGKVPGIAELLRSFSAGFAKWRYETLVTCTKALHKLRNLCQRHVREEMFQHVQDRAQIQRVVNACRTPRLWQWISLTYTKVLSKLEVIRRWGMVCPHKRCAELRKEKKQHVYCARSSRRLPEVTAQLEIWLAEFKLWEEELKEHDCENSNTMWHQVRTMLGRCRSLLKKRFHYLTLLPWRLADAATKDGAIEILRQWRLRPPEDHDPFTVKVMSAIEPDIVVVAEGGAPSVAVKDVVRIMGHTPFDESAGEGYHRDTSHEKVRAPSSTMAHLKANVRAKAVCKEIRDFMAKHHAEGRAVVRYEMLNWQRILQVEPSKQWTAMRMHPALIVKAVYREDAKANEDWGSIAQSVPRQRPVITEDLTVREKLEAVCIYI